MARYLKAFLDELFFYSGQFALFYIVMRLSDKGFTFLLDSGHLMLVIALVMQSMLLAVKGHIPLIRFPGSFLVPAIYSLSESHEGLEYFLNAAHMGFWAYALITAGIQLHIIHLKRQDKSQQLTELAVVAITISIFLFLYFYFDISKEKLPEEELTIVNIFAHLPAFLQDHTHLYIIFGGGVLALILGLGRMEITRLKDRLSALFGIYVDARIRDRIISGQAASSEKAELCVLFADLRNFTQLSEKHDADQIINMLNHYFEFWDLVVRKHGGVIDKFIGDAVMVIFGLRHQEQACEDAVKTSLELLHAWPSFQASLHDKGLPMPEGFGVGCHFGRIIIGNVGSNNRRSYTVIGDDVNLAARLESACKNQQQSLIISDHVYQLLDQCLQSKFQSLGTLEIKGKNKNIKAWGYKPI